MNIASLVVFFLIFSFHCCLAGGKTSFLSASHKKPIENLEILHWYTSGGEAAGVLELKKRIESKGYLWKDMPVSGGSGDQAMTVLRTRIASGNPPASAQLLGFDLLAWADEEVLDDLTPIAMEQKWDTLLPDALKAFSFYRGRWIGFPINIHSSNWVWGNKKIFDQLKIDPEEIKDWEDFIKVLDKIKQSGHVPIAHGGQPWQDATVFELVVLSTGGASFYKKSFIDLDKSALESDTMRLSFERFVSLRAYMDPYFSGRDWNLASAMMINGKAAMQIMGDWVKGDLLRMKKQPMKDFICFRFPGTKGALTFNSDQFAIFGGSDLSKGGRKDFISTVVDLDSQVAFNLAKGSIPARLDIGDKAKQFDVCGQQAIKEVSFAAKNNILLGSLAHGYAAHPAVKQAAYDVITAVFNQQILPKDAPKKLAKAIQSAQ